MKNRAIELPVQTPMSALRTPLAPLRSAGHRGSDRRRGIPARALSPDNNLCEQQLRDIALGRKNYLFAGSHDAARRAANLYSLASTCAQYRVPPLPYFTDVLGKLAAGWTQDRLDELLPPRWRLPEAAPPETSAP